MGHRNAGFRPGLLTAWSSLIPQAAWLVFWSSSTRVVCEPVFLSLRYVRSDATSGLAVHSGLSPGCKAMRQLWGVSKGFMNSCHFSFHIELLHNRLLSNLITRSVVLIFKRW